jgi:hypothetical protein
MKTMVRGVGVLATLLLALPAGAAEPGNDADPKEALSEKAALPTKPPTLPDEASDRAGYVHDTIAFGKKGAAERAEHSQAAKHSSDAAKDSSDAAKDAAHQSAQGAAASAAKAGNAAAQAAANQSTQGAAASAARAGNAATEAAAGQAQSSAAKSKGKGH